ncbi:MAG: TolB family protein, partial [Gemmatimonadota bacterium]
KTVPDGTEREVTGLPADPRIRDVQWAPDGSRIAFSVTADDAVELWIADLRTAAARRLLDGRLSDVLGDAFHWLPDGSGLVVKLVPGDRGAPPPPPDVPAGPVIQQNAGKVAPARTYQDLLESLHDEALFEHYFSAQVARVGLDGRITPIGEPGLIAQAEPSPNGAYLLVQTIQRPFSYLLPVYRFPARIEVWDAAGKVVRRVADLPLAEEVPIAFDAVRTGPRQIGWRADAPATLYWIEAQDGGDPRAKADVRDRVFLLAAPFRGAPVKLLDLALRFDGLRWGTDDLALVSEDWWATRKARTWVVRPGAPRARARLLFDRSSEDRYGDPGDPWTRRSPAGTSVLVTADGGRTLFFSGSGASPEGDRPFL